MGEISRFCRLAGFWAAVSLGVPHVATAQGIEESHVRAIPGITADDAFPSACVSCHVVLPDGRDVRLSALIEHWKTGVDSILLAQARAAAPTGLKLTGRHPAAEESLQSIPAGCLMCHGRDATLAPPLGRLIHRIHLVGGEANHFLTMFNGECTHCHKLDQESGEWSIPSGPEPGT